MTFIRKLMNVLDMDNWNGSESDDSMLDNDFANQYIESDDSSTDSSFSQINDVCFSTNNENQCPDSISSFNESSTEILRDEIQEDISVSSTNYSPDYLDDDYRKTKYKSDRILIKGLHLYFIDVAREIVNQHQICIIPLMREYGLTEHEINTIISEMSIAGIIDNNNQVTMTLEEFERFIDIYEPSLFLCPHTVFDKDIFMCIGEIIYDDGIENTYHSLPADEVLDYLNIMEKLGIIKYDSYSNQYSILISHDEFIKKSDCIPNSFSSSEFKDDITIQSLNSESMTGIDFEKYCAHLLSENGFINIKITPPSGDHGIDLLAEKDDVSYAIQCKYYSDSVGNSAIQQAHTGKSLYRKDIAVVMTNSYFTHQAMEEASALGVKLWDKNKIKDFGNNI